MGKKNVAGTLNAISKKSEQFHQTYFQGLSFWQIARFSLRKALSEPLQTRSAAISFNVFLSIFPLIIVFSQLIALFPVKTVESTLYGLLRQGMPDSSYRFLMDIVKSITSLKTRTGGIVSVGFLMTLIFASNGINALISAFARKDFKLKRQTFIVRRFTAIYITLLLMLLMLVTISILIFGQLYINKFLSAIYMISSVTYLILSLFKWTIIFLLVLNIVSVIYYLAPPVKHSWSYFSGGSMLTTLLIIVASYVFSYYIQLVQSFNALYGSLGAIIVLMLWIYINCLLLLVGYELNVALALRTERLKAKEKKQT